MTWSLNRHRRHSEDDAMKKDKNRDSDDAVPGRPRKDYGAPPAERPDDELRMLRRALEECRAELTELRRDREALADPSGNGRKRNVLVWPP